MSCAASPQPPRRAAVSDLAPGFRFHPTDEELVSYYLKRKVDGKPLRVDAIAEIDLYKVEPWDLPGKSRIQSRDTEWYFFSALDKKYSNRSRTNRATGSGYWKTTGKDRAVCRGGRALGMKKTLVFHLGRAPKGERTNWVMHEYRLEDEEAAVTGVQKDAYVVCRVFQKKGPGPQNGAQYGALFVEEEWEDDELPVLKKEDGVDDMNVLSNSTPTEENDNEQFMDIWAQLQVNSPLVEHGQQDDFNHLFDPHSLLKQCEGKLSSSADSESHIDVPVQQGDRNLIETGENSEVLGQSQHLVVKDDEFLELKDFAYPLEINSQEGVSFPQQMHNDINFSNNGMSPQQNLFRIEDFLNDADCSNDPAEHHSPCQTTESNFLLDLDDILGPEGCQYPSGEQKGDETQYFDASNLNMGAEVATDMKYCLDSVGGVSSEPDLVDELIAYFESTENMQAFDSGINYISNASNESNLSQVSEQNVLEHQSSQQQEDMDGHSSPLMVIPVTKNKSRVISTGGLDKSESQYDSTQDKSITKRIISMLGAIPSPPAHAAEFPLKQAESVEKSLTVRSSSSVHVAAGMVQIHGMTTSGAGNNWSVLKNRNSDFLTCGIASGEKDSLLGCDAIPKMPSGIVPFVMRNSFHLLFLSVLFLASSFKIWICISGR